MLWWRGPVARTSPGHVVVYRLPATVRGRTAAGYAALYAVQGEFIDRIVAGPGQSVSWKGRQLTVDGQASPWQPLYPQGVPCDLEFVVPEGCFAILPGYDLPGTVSIPPQMWQTVSCVPRQNILGPVLLWHRPFWRWRLL